MVKLLRIEDKNGDGMYRNLSTAGEDSLGQMVFGNSWNNNNHPSPWDDYELSSWWREFGDSCLFCFKDEKQLLRWVYLPEWRHLMDSLGAKLVVLEVEDEDCYIGEHQAVYLPHKVKSRREFKVNSFDLPYFCEQIKNYLNF